MDNVTHVTLLGQTVSRKQSALGETNYRLGNGFCRPSRSATAEHGGFMSNRRPSCDRAIHSARSRGSHFVAILAPAPSPEQIDADTSRSSARASFALSSV